MPNPPSLKLLKDTAFLTCASEAFQGEGAMLWKYMLNLKKLMRSGIQYNNNKLIVGFAET